MKNWPKSATMENEDLITLNDFCSYYSIEVSFIRSLNGAGLMEIVTLRDTDYLHRGDLGYLEKMVRLHQDLDINVEGLAAVVHLLEKVENLQVEINMLRNRLSFYEG